MDPDLDDPFQEHITHFYKKICLNLKEGIIVPNHLPSFKKALTYFNAFLTRRLPESIKIFMGHGEDGKGHISVIPIHYMGPPPSFDDIDFWGFLWESDGDFYKKFNGMLPKRPGLKTMLAPYVIPSTSKELPTVCAVVLVWAYSPKKVKPVSRVLNYVEVCPVEPEAKPEAKPESKKPEMNYCEVYVKPDEEEKKFDIRTTIVTGIVCRRCGNELPPMTAEDHLEGRFNQTCPHK